MALHAAGRIVRLKQDIEQALQHYGHGTSLSIARRRQECNALVQNLIEIGRVVPRLVAINESILKDLIVLWRSRGNSDKSISNKVSVLRQLLGNSQTLPNNKALNINVKPKSRAFILPDKVIDPNVITDPSIQLICLLQRWFGLKKREAIHFDIFMAASQADAVVVSRAAAYNSKGRHIPLWCEEQRQMLAKLQASGLTKFITPSYPAHLLAEVHRYTLRGLGIQQDEYFRYQYIITRFQHLQTQMEHMPLLSVLQQELGYQSQQALKEVLKCLDVY